MSIIPAGRIFVITADTYSDYFVETVARALTAFSTDNVREAFEIAHPREPGDWRWSLGFVNWLLNESGWAEEVEASEFHYEQTFGGWDISFCKIRREELK